MRYLMRKPRNTIKFIAFSFPLLAFMPLAHAQFLPEPIQYVVAPEVPGPNQQVTIEAQGVGTFLGDATITWRKDGKVVKTGAGERSYAFVTGSLGSVTNLRVDIAAQGGSFTKTFIFRPSSVNLVWEADTSAPPLYLGKPLYSGGSPLKVVAFPIVVINGARVAAQSLSYQWSRNGEPLPAQSGLGRNTLALDGDQLQPEEAIGVDVYFGASLVGRGGVVVPASQGQVLFYERNPLRGLLTDLALPSAIALQAKEITVAAQPYYFSSRALANGQLAYQWTLGGEDISGPDSARGLLTLRQTGSGAGQADLAVSIQNNDTEQLVQSAESLIRIVLGQQGSAGSLFGL